MEVLDFDEALEKVTVRVRPNKWTEEEIDQRHEVRKAALLAKYDVTDLWDVPVNELHDLIGERAGDYRESEGLTREDGRATDAPPVKRTFDLRKLADKFEIRLDEQGWRNATLQRILAVERI